MPRSWNRLEQDRRNKRLKNANPSHLQHLRLSPQILLHLPSGCGRVWKGRCMTKQHDCVWCCKPESGKHPESKLSLISYAHAWAIFKNHTVALEDQNMRDRINCLIDYAADQPYTIEIRYHSKCWLKYVRKYQKMSADDKLPLMQNVSLREARTVFFENSDL